MVTAFVTGRWAQSLVLSSVLQVSLRLAAGRSAVCVYDPPRFISSACERELTLSQHPVKHKMNNLRALPYLGPFPWSRLPPRMEQKADQAAPLSRAWASHGVSQLLVWFLSRVLGSAGGQELVCWACRSYAHPWGRKGTGSPSSRSCVLCEDGVPCSWAAAPTLQCR